MDKLVIRGGAPLAGTIRVSGAKNTVAHTMPAALLTAGPVRLTNVPALKDVQTMARLLRTLGASVEVAEGRCDIRADALNGADASYDLVRTMRSSFVVLGPLLARLGRARVSLPGGCAIGPRPVDLHLKGLAAMGASITTAGGYVEAVAPRLRGARIVFDHVSVGATLHLMMAAALADGETVLAGAAREPEVVDLADLLNAMGGRVLGAGSDTVTVEGVRELHGAEHDNLPDRIEAGTWLVASLLTGGGLGVAGARRDHLGAVEARLLQAGAAIEERDGALRAVVRGRWRASDVTTLPYPGFPTDMQAQWMAAMALAEGTTVIRETIFENRFQHVPELVRLGAEISVQDRNAVVRGVPGLRGAPVMVSDLRAGVSLVLAALAASGTTEIHRIYHLDRGYDRLVEKLRGVGAAIERVPGPAT